MIGFFKKEKSLDFYLLGYWELCFPYATSLALEPPKSLFHGFQSCGPSSPLTAHLCPYHLEASGGVEFALHHIKEDGEGSFAQLHLRYQCHF